MRLLKIFFYYHYYYYSVCAFTEKKKTWRCRSFTLHEIKNLQEGEELHEAMESDPAFVEVKHVIKFFITDLLETPLFAVHAVLGLHCEGVLPFEENRL